MFDDLEGIIRTACLIDIARLRSRVDGRRTGCHQRDLSVRINGRHIRIGRGIADAQAICVTERGIAVVRRSQGRRITGLRPAQTRRHPAHRKRISCGSCRVFIGRGGRSRNGRGARTLEGDGAVCRNGGHIAVAGHIGNAQSMGVVEGRKTVAAPHRSIVRSGGPGEVSALERTFLGHDGKCIEGAARFMRFRCFGCGRNRRRSFADEGDRTVRRNARYRRIAGRIGNAQLRGIVQGRESITFAEDRLAAFRRPAERRRGLVDRQGVGSASGLILGAFGSACRNRGRSSRYQGKGTVRRDGRDGFVAGCVGDGLLAGIAQRRETVVGADGGRTTLGRPGKPRRGFYDRQRVGRTGSGIGGCLRRGCRDRGRTGGHQGQSPVAGDRGHFRIAGRESHRYAVGIGQARETVARPERRLAGTRTPFEFWIDQRRA